MFLGDLSTLQTASIFAGAPLLIIMSMLMLSIIKAAKYDLYYQPDYSLKTIHIEEVPDNAPWEHGETSEAPEGSVLAQQAIYEELRLNDMAQNDNAQIEQGERGNSWSALPSRLVNCPEIDEL